MSEWKKPDWYMDAETFGRLVHRVATATAQERGLSDRCHPEDLSIHWEITARNIGVVLTELHRDD